MSIARKFKRQGTKVQTTEAVIEGTEELSGEGKDTKESIRPPVSNTTFGKQNNTSLRNTGAPKQVVRTQGAQRGK